LPAPPEHVRLDVNGVPGRVLMKHYRIDDTHSNAWTAWKKMGSPQNPTAEQYTALEAAGQLELLESPHWIATGKPIEFELPRQGVSLVQLTF
jgi:xylan 1,4-beta-xylosidase